MFLLPTNFLQTNVSESKMAVKNKEDDIVISVSLAIIHPWKEMICFSIAYAAITILDEFMQVLLALYVKTNLQRIVCLISLLLD